MVLRLIEEAITSVFTAVFATVTMFSFEMCKVQHRGNEGKKIKIYSRHYSVIGLKVLFGTKQINI